MLLELSWLFRRSHLQRKTFEGSRRSRPGTESQVWYLELSLIRTRPLLACTTLNEESWKSRASPSYLHCPAAPTVESSTFARPKLLLNSDPEQGGQASDRGCYKTTALARSPVCRWGKQGDEAHVFQHIRPPPIPTSAWSTCSFSGNSLWHF